MRILVAFDKFKGSLTANQIGQIVSRVLGQKLPDVEVALSPIADGGEGFTAAVMSACGGDWYDVDTVDAQGRPVTARYGIVEKDGHKEAVMEMSAASGLAIVKDIPLQPLTASTRGTGEMMRDALSKGVDRILIGIGGSATNDGGSGMASAWGCQFLDSSGQPVSNLPADLERVESVSLASAPKCEIVVACDVKNPLLGPDGCSAVYGPQKGVKDIEFFDNRLKRLADIASRDLGCDNRNVPGAGAAGGLGYGLMTFTGAVLQCGFDIVADISGLRERIEKADLIITGEGMLDEQTLHGKGPHGVALMARELGKKVVGMGGIIKRSPELEACFDGLIQLKPEGMPTAEAIGMAQELLEEAVAQHAEWFKELVSPVNREKSPQQPASV